ncbi:hypothetical protein [Deinococcus sp. QL22]|uniref:hypothetical protein n=1 Tax=Deinococcus sp. QL22 TaxID=2939437 RepID=UPI002017D170|nr:hypothetical protein [Deinococcus sp. QL22]UQN05397.1 hypothetical protein M1R55_10970 [Deinococcus sp. QL22]
MVPTDGLQLPDDVDARTERSASASTRRHVGAAGLVQLDILEGIIHAGREQLVVTQALRRVVASTIEQQRATPLAQIGTLAHEHQVRLKEIISSGRTQINTASKLRVIIQGTLAEIRATPLEHVSGHLLTTLGESVRQQVQDLEDIIQAAVTYASTLEQITQLEGVSAQAAAQLQQVDQERGERELMQLERQAAETLEYIRTLERVGRNHAAQKRELIAEAQTAESRISVLEEDNANRQAELTELTSQRDAAVIQREALENAARGSKVGRESQE